MQEKSRPHRIKETLLHRAEKIGIKKSAERGRLLTINDVINEALELGLSQLEVIEPFRSKRQPESGPKKGHEKSVKPDN